MGTPRLPRHRDSFLLQHRDSMERKDRKKVLRSISNGMYVVTSKSADRYGTATVTWLTQSSFEPPLLVAAIRPGSSLSECLQDCRHAVVHVIGAHQQEIVQRFFSRTEVDLEAAPPTLGGLPFTLSESGIPILNDAAAYAECRLIETIDCGGDHNLVVLEVTSVSWREDFEPLTVRNSPWEYGG